MVVTQIDKTNIYKQELVWKIPKDLIVGQIQETKLRRYLREPFLRYSVRDSSIFKCDMDKLTLYFKPYRKLGANDTVFQFKIFELEMRNPTVCHIETRDE